MRKELIAGNWKMYKTSAEAVSYVEALKTALVERQEPVYLAVPFTAIHPCAEKAQGSHIVIGAQNMNDASEGAFTGEIAATMLKEAGAQFVLLGHSERRHIFKESNAFINRKVHQAIKENLIPFLCVGETKADREEGRAEEVVALQLKESLKGVTETQTESLVIAYEPVWAIGNGKPATAQEAQEMHAFVRKIAEEIWSTSTAEKLTLVYGGSVNPENAATMMQQPDIDGLLVGGASLSVETFTKIINYR